MGRFLIGAILGIVALALIIPLRFRLHDEPLSLDVAPQRDVVSGQYASYEPNALAMLWSLKREYVEA